LSNYTYGHKISFAIDKQIRSSERVCIAAIHH
jgi:hypothetical protein